MFSIEEKMGLGLVATGLVTSLTVFAGWVTHIIVCIQNEQWVLLIAGALAFPIGVVHGIGQWFGIW